MGRNLGAAVVIFAYAIVLYLFVRPKSQGPKLIAAAGTALKGVISAGTGGGSWSG